MCSRVFQGYLEVFDSDFSRSQMIYRPFEVPSQDEFEELGIFTEQGVEPSNRSFVTTDASGADITFTFDIHGRSVGIRVASDEKVILELFRKGFASSSCSERTDVSLSRFFSKLMNSQDAYASCLDLASHLPIHRHGDEG